jgi:hypothetical protein
VRIFPFLPGKSLEVITFEVKPLNYFGVDGVFEAAAFSVFAQRSYLAVQVPENLGDSEDFDRLLRECKRFGIGLMTFVQPDNWETFEEVLIPEHRPPDPAETNAFISTQIAEEHKRRLQDLIR